MAFGLEDCGHYPGGPGASQALSLEGRTLNERKEPNPMAKDADGMKGNRSRNQDGQLRDKRDDTHMGTIERQYGRDFNVRSDMHLGTYLKQTGQASLNDLLRGGKGK